MKKRILSGMSLLVVCTSVYAVFKKMAIELEHWSTMLFTSKNYKFKPVSPESTGMFHMKHLPYNSGLENTKGVKGPERKPTKHTIVGELFDSRNMRLTRADNKFEIFPAVSGSFKQFANIFAAPVRVRQKAGIDL